jgi:hypothetical protein
MRRLAAVRRRLRCQMRQREAMLQSNIILTFS